MQIQSAAPATGPLTTLMRRAEQIGSKARASNTLRAYAHDWAHFTGWCARMQSTAMPARPETVILYLTDLSSTAKMSTLARRVATISQAHQAAGLESPTHRSAVRLFLRALRRDKAGQGSRSEPKRAILGTELARMVQAIPATPRGKRDRAVLLLGFLGALRRSELVALDTSDIEFMETGLVLHLRRSKTDPEGKGEKRGVPKARDSALCAVHAVREWLAAAGIAAGPLFRPLDRGSNVGPGRLSDRTVVRIVKRYAAAAGIDAAEVAGHSLRSGLATTAAYAGKSERAIMNQTGHKSVQTVRQYIRTGSLFRENAAEGLL